MHALVTGGGGFLGSAIVRRLLGRGDRVRVLGRHSYPELAAAGAECVVGDIRAGDAVTRACGDGIDTVFHVAALPGVWGRREDFFGINTRGTATVLQGCIRNGVGRLVYTSSPSVVFDARSRHIEGGDETLPYPQRYLAAYPASKAWGEKMVLDANGWEMVIESRPETDGSPVFDSEIRRLATCALRPHLIWGPGDPHLLPRIAAMARAGKLVRVGDGTNKVTLTYIDNAADAHIRAADALTPDSPLAGQAYFVGDAEPVVLWDWIDDLLRRAGLPTVHKAVSYRTARAAGLVLEIIHRLVPRLGEPRMTRFVAAQLAGAHWFNLAKAKRDFDYEPEIDNETGLKRAVEWLKAEGGRRRDEG